LIPSGQTKLRLPKPLRDSALAQHEMFMELQVDFFNRIPQLLLMPSGRRIMWTAKATDCEFPEFSIPIYNQEKWLRKIMFLIQTVMVEGEYEESKRRFDAYLQGRASQKDQRHASDRISA